MFDGDTRGYLRADIRNVILSLASMAGQSYVAQGRTHREYWEGVRDTLNNFALAFGIPVPVEKPTPPGPGE